MLDVKAITQIGKVVPVTVINKQYFRPILSDILPNKGHAKKANNPLTVSMTPTIA
jgi:hypothetical protein